MVLGHPGGSSMTNQMTSKSWYSYSTSKWRSRRSWEKRPSAPTTTSARISKGSLPSRSPFTPTTTPPSSTSSVTRAPIQHWKLANGCALRRKASRKTGWGIQIA